MNEGTGPGQTRVLGLLRATNIDTAASADTGWPVESPQPGAGRGLLRRHTRRGLPVLVEVGVLLSFALLAAIVLKVFFVQAFYIPSASMEPSLIAKDRILVQKVSYWAGEGPSRGDVVVFEDPGGWIVGPTEDRNSMQSAMAAVGLYPTADHHLVKRVIGVEGDVIVCCDKKGRLSVNGEPLNEESYIAEDALAQCAGPRLSCDWTAGPVPAGSVFVMGDNRGHSADSTAHMCAKAAACPSTPYVPVENVVGKAFALVLPLSRSGWINRPDAFSTVPDGKKASD